MLWFFCVIYSSVMNIVYVDPLLSEVSERSERLLASMQDEIDRIMQMEIALQEQLDSIENPISDYNEPLLLGRVRQHTELSSDDDDSESKDEEVFGSPVTQDGNIRFNPDVFMIEGDNYFQQHLRGRHLTFDEEDDATVFLNYTPFYYMANEYEDSDTDTLVDFEWENPYLSPYDSN